jgi:RNase P subunit RPR2
MEGAKFRLTLGSRTLLAASCRKCGKLFPGSAFQWRWRNSRDKAAYIDQRCSNCKWGAKLKGRTEASNDRAVHFFED